MATWPPSPSKKFINLAAINREEVTTEELHKFMLETLNKGVDTILETKAPVCIEQLLDTKPGEKQECVLVEGAPGVGKTTLSWEVCKRWAAGNLFKQYSLLLLLRLIPRLHWSKKASQHGTARHGTVGNVNVNAYQTVPCRAVPCWPGTLRTTELERHGTVRHGLNNRCKHKRAEN